jgi:hypothetical protein
MYVLMGITHLRKWDVTAIEIALDLQAPRFSDAPGFVFSGPAEPRICLVTGFALTSQLKRIVAAVDRVVPAHAPAGLRIALSTGRNVTSMTGAIAVAPMDVLLRLQSKLVRAIEPGLAHDGLVLALTTRRGMDEAAIGFIRDFIPAKTVPAFEPSQAAVAFRPTEVKAVGITIYRLGRGGAPESILAHWTYPPEAHRSVHLRGGP